jgi:WD40 repeat protein
MIACVRPGVAWWQALTRGLLAALLAVGFAAAAQDQPAEQRDLVRVREVAEQPWLRINAGGHTAAVHALAYTPDGKRLCSAGLDKVVQVWNLAAVGRDLRRVPLRERTIRWQVARALRGSIYALSTAPSDGLLALGGYGAMGSLGEILLVDPIEGTLRKVLQGHRQTICALSFSNDGRWLASSDAAGQSILWQRGQWRPRVLYEPDLKTYDPELARSIRSQPKFRPIVILGSSDVVVPACIGRDSGGRPAWKLQRIRLDRPTDVQTLDRVHLGLVTALAASADGGRLASADLAGRLLLWDLKAGGAPAELPTRDIVLSLSFSPDGRTLAAGTAVDPIRKTSQLQVWDVATWSLRRNRSLPDHVHACAISPLGNDVAYVGGKDNEVFVEPVRAGQERVTLRGTGRRIFKVAFARAEPLYRIAFGVNPREQGFNDNAPLEESFDPVRLELGAVEAVKPADWLPVDWCRGPWSAQLQPDGRLQLLRDGAPQGRVVLDANREGRVRSYCWIGDAQGEPLAIAVGTDVQNSIFVYRLARDGPCPMLRHFRGHHDYITSLGVSRDHRWLASASADGTINLWSLAALEQGGESPGRWGGDFAVQGSLLAAKRVHPAGPLFSSGLREGDVLRKMLWNDGLAVHEETRPETMRELLRSLPWTAQVAFQTERNGASRPAFQRLPAWEPLATLFVSADREWAFWTPQGYYDASINGFTLFGWQVNRGLEKLPDFYRADQFRKKLERPDVMERLLVAGSLPDALLAVRQTPRPEAAPVLIEQIVATPQLEILSPRSGQVLAGNATTLRARITMPVAVKLVASRVFANGVAATGQRLVHERLLAAQKELIYDWDVRLPADPRNLIELVVGTDAPTTAFRNILVERPAGVRPDRASRLRILALGINKYRDPAVQPLAFAVADARSVAATLQEQSQGLYTVERAAVLSNEEVTPRRWRTALDDVCRDLKADARPDDLLVLFFAGHAFIDVQTQQYYYVGHDFRLSDLDKRQYEACISWNDLRALAAIPCRKLVLLDTCHAGAIQPLRSRNLKAAVRELQDDVVFTFAASAGDELSAENKAWGHGAFTKSLLEAIRGRAPGPGALPITLNEVVDYVQSAVRQLTKGRQNPTAAPHEILSIASMVLARRGPSSTRSGTEP